jgi:hypothetical protein
MVRGGRLWNLKKLSVMANNFRVVGIRYFSKGGHDSNDGQNDDTPKKSISGVGSGINVLGAGVYMGNNSIIDKTLWGDGEVVIENSTQSGGTYRNLMLKNCVCTGNINAVYNMFDCIVIDCALGNSHYNLNPFRSIFVRCTFSNTKKVNTQASIWIDTNVPLFDTSGIGGQFCRNGYFDFTCQLVHTANPVNTYINGFRNNNIQGVIILGGIKYAIQDQFTGTPQENGYASDVYWLNEANLTANGYTGTISGWDTAVATCINRDPKFNNASKLDFTLQADSPHIGRALDGFSNIGGTEYAQSFYAGISNPNILLFEHSESIDVTTNNNDWRLKNDEVEGWIRAVIRVSNTDVQISRIPYIGNYAFDADQPGGSSTNMNVPDSKPVTNEYPAYLQTTTQAGNDTTLIIAAHGASVGDWLWVDGQYREITGVPDADTVTFADSLRAIVVVGTVVKIGAFSALAALNPNRLNMKMRSSKQVVTEENLNESLIWDNDDLAPAGQYLAQEWNNAPQIDNLNEIGFGDDNFDSNYANPINLKYIDLIIYLRNDYKS